MPVKESKAPASSGITHYVLMLDDSGSMTGAPCNDLKKACNTFLNELVKSPDVNSTRISCIIYNHHARTVFEDEIPTNELNEKIEMVSGGTEYGPALDKAGTICDKVNSKVSQFVWYFMSDGQPFSYPTAALTILKKRVCFSKIKFYACGFGRSEFS